MRSHSAVSGCTARGPRGEQDLGAVYQGLQPLGRPLVADRLGDVGVLGGGADHRADPRRGRRDLLAVLDAVDGLDRDDVLEPVTPLRASKWSSRVS